MSHSLKELIVPVAPRGPRIWVMFQTLKLNISCIRLASSPASLLQFTLWIMAFIMVYMYTIVLTLPPHAYCYDGLAAAHAAQRSSLEALHAERVCKTWSCTSQGVIVLFTGK